MHNRDVIACAPTGSGKTLAFSIPILHDLKSPEKGGFRALILSPTRELAQQIDREIKALCGTKPFKICVLNTISNTGNNNAVSQYQNFDILITTPLRLVTAIKNESIKLHKWVYIYSQLYSFRANSLLSSSPSLSPKSVRHIVLDEADRLLDDGFLDQIDDILTACTNSKLQRSLYSATMPSGVETIANTFMKDAVRVIIGAR